MICNLMDRLVSLVPLPGCLQASSGASEGKGPSTPETVVPQSCWNRELYLKAARFACEAHAEQRVKDSPANYSLHLASVSMETLAAWQGGAQGSDQPINIYIGEELLDSVIANSQNRRALRSGGR